MNNVLICIIGHIIFTQLQFARHKTSKVSIMCIMFNLVDNVHYPTVMITELHC
jgi:secreted trypsin-like serine protease